MRSSLTRAGDGVWLVVRTVTRVVGKGSAMIGTGPPDQLLVTSSWRFASCSSIVSLVAWPSVPVAVVARICTSLRMTLWPPPLTGSL